MTTDEDLGQLLRAHLAERADGGPADGALEAVLAVTAGLRPRPRRLVWLHGGSMGSSTRLAVSRPMILVLLTVGLIVALALGALVAGAFRVAVAPAMPHRNGAIVVVLINGGRVAVDPSSGATTAYGQVTCRPGGAFCNDPRTGRLLDFADSGVSVSWSPDGTNLASQYGGAIWVLDPTASDTVRDTVRVTSAGNIHASWPHQVVSWSPDGSHLAFASGGEIYSISMDGSRLTDVSRFCGCEASEPAWSPDGTRIAFVTDLSIATINVDGTGFRWIVGPFAGVRLPSPSPFGSSVGTTVSSPAWSPDGSRLAYLEDASDTARLVTIRADGSDRRVIFTVADCCITDWGDVAWSPDGTRIATILGSAPTRDWSLYVMDASGAHAVELVHHVKPGLPAWQPVP